MNRLSLGIAVGTGYCPSFFKENYLEDVFENDRIPRPFHQKKFEVFKDSYDFQKGSEAKMNSRKR